MPATEGGNQKPEAKPEVVPTQPPEPNGEDWKAKYEEILSHSREWEKKAKANKDAADKLDALEKAKQTDSDKIESLTKRLDEKERAEARATLVAKVAKEKGVPADLLAGDDEESLIAWADRLNAAITPKPAAKVPKPGSFDRGGSGDDDPMRGVVKQLFGNQ